MQVKILKERKKIMNISISGGTGYIGKKLVSKLSSLNNIKILSRKLIPSEDSCLIIIGNLSPPNNLYTFLSNCEIFIHCAAEIKDPSKMLNVNINGTAELLEVAKFIYQSTNKKIHWVQLSSAGVYSNLFNNLPITEISPTNTSDKYEISKLKSDELVIAAGKEGYITYTILRPTAVFSFDMPNDSIRGLIKVIKNKMFFYIGNNKTILNYIHVDDVVEALILCAINEKAKGNIFNISNDCYLEDVVKNIAYFLNITEPKNKMPTLLVLFIVRIMNKFSINILNQKRIKSLTSTRSFNTNKIEHVLNFYPEKKLDTYSLEIIKSMYEK